MKQELMYRMETNMPGRMETDRTMWFSMWFLVAIATFGLAFFPMFYYLVERRNKHFLRQEELENRVKTYFRKEGKELQSTANSLPKRNAKLWAVSIILILPVFVVAYFLSKDLLLHEKRQQASLTRLFPERVYVPQNLAIKKYALITVVTLGVGIIYWLYKIINTYNSHFKEQRKIEDEIIRLMEEKGYVEPV
jgi:NADH:ubiquinone oxidoreductase subunit 5 (subunit L)/multisubunit Na+/H+ antiporter MnhA subunit